MVTSGPIRTPSVQGISTPASIWACKTRSLAISFREFSCTQSFAPITAAELKAYTGKGISLDDAAAPPDPSLSRVAGAVSELVSPETLAEVRSRRLERGVAAIAAAHPVVRDELEDLLWP